MSGTHSAYGTITVHPPVPPEQPTQDTLEAVYRWTPAICLRSQLSLVFQLDLNCWRRSDGRRFFSLAADPLTNPWRKAFQGGLAILSVQEQMSRQQTYSYRAMSLLFWAARSKQEHLMRRFQHVRDLYLRPGSRRSADENHILPLGLGMASDGTGTAWSLETFLEEGTVAAQAAGVSCPEISDQIQYGLYQAARLSPLRLETSEMGTLIRQSLFQDRGERDYQMTEETSAQLEDRLLTAIWPHLEDDEEAFHRWFTGAESSVVKQIAKQRTAPGGEFPISLVRTFLLETGWRAYHYFSQCTERMMQDFWNVLPEVFSPEERQLFARSHFNQPAFGNLPLFLISERFPEIKLAANQYVDGDDDMVPIIHRLLSYYAETVHRRREADRTAQQRSRHRRRFGNAFETPYRDELFDAGPSGDLNDPE